MRDNREFLLRFYGTHSIGAEIGVWKSDFSRLILRGVNPSVMYLVDPWRYRPEYKNEIYAKNMNQEKMDAIYRTVRRRLENDRRVRIRRQKSEDFFKTIPAKSLDWVYIDGDHHYREVKTDLDLSFKAIKVGGYITGDDYVQGHPWWGTQVVRAVMEFIRKNHRVEVVLVRSRQFVLQRTE